ncbi:MAG: hypothetical protein PHQ64_00430 [Bacilli bacterium]|nr:hypothetical protein [Bacilli bacterium]
MVTECNFIKTVNECYNRKSFSHAYLIEIGNNINYKNYINYMLNKVFNNDFDIDYFNSSFLENFLIFHKEEGNIKKEFVNLVQEKFNKTNDMNKSIYLIEDASKFNLSSANSLLKFLEEPPSGVHAILLCSNKNSVIPTILSRCVVLSLPDFSKSVEQIDFEYISLIEKIEEIGVSFIAEYGSYIDFKKITREEFLNIFNNFRDILEYVSENIMGEYVNSKLSLFLKYNDKLSLIKKISIVDNYKKRIDSNVNLNLLFDSFIIEYCEVK